MLRLAGYDIVFQEVPDEVTLALTLSGCPNRCKGCHSPHLQESVGEELNEELLAGLLGSYGEAITCLCFMGGDAAPEEVKQLSAFVRSTTHGQLKVAWYSGKAVLPTCLSAYDFDYIKLGAYVEALGGLKSTTTNQRFYRVEEGRMVDMTRRFFVTI